MSARSGHTGFTLIEIMVAVAVLSVALGVAAVALRPPGLDVPDPTSALREARSESLATGRPVVKRPDSAHNEPILLLPDGRVVGVLPARWVR